MEEVTRALKIAICLLSALSLAGCGSWPRVARYRLTVEIDDYGRRLTGSGVQEEYCSFNDGLIRMGNALNCGIKGEAVVVNLGADRKLFVLLHGDHERPRASGSGWGIFVHAHRDLYDPVGMTAAAFDRIAALKTPVTTNTFGVPLMVRLRNINDPKSVERVDPERLDATFGPGVRFVKATVVMTDDPVTTGIEKTLPWLDGLKDHTLGGTWLTPIKNFSETLNITDFRWGF